MITRHVSVSAPFCLCYFLSLSHLFIFSLSVSLFRFWEISSFGVGEVGAESCGSLEALPRGSGRSRSGPHHPVYERSLRSALPAAVQPSATSLCPHRASRHPNTHATAIPRHPGVCEGSALISTCDSVYVDVSFDSSALQ